MGNVCLQKKFKNIEISKRKPNRIVQDGKIKENFQLSSQHRQNNNFSKASKSSKQKGFSQNNSSFSQNTAHIDFSNRKNKKQQKTKQKDETNTSVSSRSKQPIVRRAEPFEKLIIQIFERKYRNLAILDWDDTIFCTTFLKKKDIFNLNAQALEEIKKVQQSALALLNRIHQISQICIITSSEQNWVHYSSRLYFPRLFQFLQEHQVQIISAAEFGKLAQPQQNKKVIELQKLSPAEKSSTSAKVKAFKQLYKIYNPQLLKNIISIGDSNSEMIATQSLKNIFINASIKKIKLKQCPLPAELVKQHNLLNSKFNKLLQLEHNTKIRLQRIEKDKSQKKQQTQMKQSQ